MNELHVFNGAGRGLRELHLFAGCGGGVLGGILLGHTCVCAVEIEPYCRKVLLQRQRDGILPKFPIWDDVRTFDGTPWRGKVDVVCGGFPCQKFSTAASGRNNSDDLWPFMRRAISEISPRFVLAENVCESAIEIAAGQLEFMGYRVKATALSASDVGADHVRKRYWLFAYADHKGQLLGKFNAKMAILPRICPRVWDTFPNESGVANGVAHRVDRLKAIGNGQVPSVVRLAWETLI